MTRTVYFNDPNHHTWLSHYVPKTFSGYSLVFTKEWKESFLPPDSTNEFNISLLDTTDEKIYQSKMYVAYERNKESILNEDYDSIEVESLNGYFYGSHHCPCHRKSDARKAGAIIENDECEGNRFLIHSITCDKAPGLNLYSEVFTEEQLEKMLVTS